MYSQIKEDALFIMLYGVVTAMAIIASCYLLFRRANAIAPDITPPVRLRRWTAAFIASIALNHVWYMPIMFLTSSEDIRLCDLVGGLLDCMTVIPLAIVVLMTMLQDRRRPLWPVAVMVAPLVAGGVLCVSSRSYAFLPMQYAYFMLMGVGLIIYFIHALRQYGRWLRDNYADLEHKEVWHSFVVLVIMMLVFGTYTYIYEGAAYLYALQVGCVVLVCYLLWRVETLSDLSICVETPQCDVSTERVHSSEMTIPDDLKTPQPKDLTSLLQRHCIDTQLYLQHDLNIAQLAKAIGTNRFYLSQYFSRQGMTYNAYINTLRINHFISLYHKATASQRHVTAKQLASDSGFRSYTTFSTVFKQLKGQTVTAWIRDTARQ